MNHTICEPRQETNNNSRYYLKWYVNAIDHNNSLLVFLSNVDNTFKSVMGYSTYDEFYFDTLEDAVKAVKIYQNTAYGPMTEEAVPSTASVQSKPLFED